MTEKFKDAYPPEDGQEYAIIKLTIRDADKQDSAEIKTVTEEYVRVPKDVLAEMPAVKKDPDKREFNGNPDVAKIFKQKMADIAQAKGLNVPISTDIMDENNVQLPGRVTTKTLEGIGDTQTQKTSIHIKNGKAHSPTLPDGSRKPAITDEKASCFDHSSISNDNIVRMHAENGKYNNMVQPDGSVEPAKVEFLRDGRPASRTYMENGVETNLKTADGQVAEASFENYGYDTIEDPGHVINRHYKTDGKANDVVMDGQLHPAKYFKDGMKESITFMQNGEAHDPTFPDGTTGPAVLEIYDGEIRQSGHRNGDVTQNKDIVWQKDGGITASTWGEQLEGFKQPNSNLPPVLGVSRDAEGGVQVGFGNRRAEVSNAELQTLARENVAFFNGVTQEREVAQNTYKRTAGLGI